MYKLYIYIYIYIYPAAESAIAAATPASMLCHHCHPMMVLAKNCVQITIVALRQSPISCWKLTLPGCQIRNRLVVVNLNFERTDIQSYVLSFIGESGKRGERQN